MNRDTEQDRTAGLERRVAELEAENRRLSSLAGDAARTARRRHAEQIASVVEKTDLAIVVHRGLAPLYFNPGLARLLGLCAREDYDDIMSFVFPEDRPAVAGVIAKFLKGGAEPVSGTFRVVRADGSPLWVEASTTAVIWDGELAVATAMNDIDARKVAEGEVRRSRRLFQTAFDASPDIMSINEIGSGRYIDVNRAFIEVTGYAREEVIGRTTRELRFVDDATFARLNDALRGQDSVRNLQLQARVRSGELRTFLLNGEVMRFPNQTLILMVSSDITERRRQEAELQRSRAAAEQANRSKSQFLASVSHELRTPLNAIIGFSEVMCEQMLGPLGVRKYADYAGDIHKSGLHLLEIINDLLDLSKMEAGKLDLRPERLVPAEVIADCLRFVEGRASERRVTLARDLPRDLAHLFADPRLLRQILLNLLSNAVKFAPAAGTVSIAARLDPDGSMTIQVTDTGPGMTADEVAVALTPFGQVAGSLARVDEGTGLGLPLAQQMAQLHGAQMEIQSAPGVGTAITVRMPPERVLPIDPDMPDPAASGRAGPANRENA